MTCLVCEGDGKTDDTAALQRAVAELTAGGRPGVLAFEPGTYVLTAMINVTAPLVLRGAGIDATTLYFPKSLSEVNPGRYTVTVTAVRVRCIMASPSLQTVSCTLSPRVLCIRKRKGMNEAGCAAASLPRSRGLRACT